MAAATLSGAQADAMRAAAANEGGAMNGFMGMGMAMGAGGANTAALFEAGAKQQQAQQAQQQSAPAAGVQTVVLIFQDQMQSFVRTVAIN